MQVRRSLLAAFVLVAFALMGTNIALVKQVRTLAGLNKAYEANLHLGVGAKVPPLSGSAPGGTSTVVRYDRNQLKTLLLVYAPSCPYCGLNWVSWRELLNQFDPARVRAVAVSVEGAGLSQQFLEQVGLTKAATVLLPDFHSVVSYRLRYTPQTILIGPDGKVEGIWSGVLSSQQTTEISRASLAPEQNSSVQERAGK
jgi:peroxiredoxin